MRNQANYRIVDKIPITITIKTGTTFAELFPDEVLRACIVDNLNEQNSTSYTQETVDINDVLSMTELDCAGDGNEAITNARGIEKMTSLKSLNLSNNSISKINLSKNKDLETLDLRGNTITELDIQENTKLSEFLIDGEKLNGEQAVIETPAYVEVSYDDEDNPSLIMDISDL